MFSTQVDLIVMGLGNPGPDYLKTRHNIGFEFVNDLAAKLKISFSNKHRLVHIAEGKLANRRIVLARPKTFVNKSGESAAYLLSRYDVDVTKLLTVYDDIHIPVGKIRLRPKGSAGGHNGIRSIIDSLLSDAFPRLRIGIGMPEHQEKQIAYVLGNPTSEEKKMIDDAIRKGTLAVGCILETGIDNAMSEYN